MHKFFKMIAVRIGILSVTIGALICLGLVWNSWVVNVHLPVGRRKVAESRNAAINFWQNYQSPNHGSGDLAKLSKDLDSYYTPEKSDSGLNNNRSIDPFYYRDIDRSTLGYVFGNKFDDSKSNGNGEQWLSHAQNPTAEFGKDYVTVAKDPTLKGLSADNLLVFDPLYSLFATGWIWFFVFIWLLFGSIFCAFTYSSFCGNEDGLEWGTERNDPLPVISHLAAIICLLVANPPFGLGMAVLVLRRSLSQAKKEKSHPYWQEIHKTEALLSELKSEEQTDSVQEAISVLERALATYRSHTVRVDDQVNGALARERRKITADQKARALSPKIDGIVSDANKINATEEIYLKPNS